MPLIIVPTMKTQRALLFTVLLAVSGSLRAEIKETTVEYKSGDVVCEGLHVVDTAKTGKLPSVLIIHQWTGLSENEKMRARMLAELGYNVFAADIYGKGVRPQPPEAGKEAGKYKTDRKLYRERMLSALEVLNKNPHTDAAKVAAIGYCFGGTGVIELARSGALVKGVVSFHGGLDSPNPTDGKNIKGKVLALHGADDPFVPAKDIAAFEKEMQDAKVDYKLVSYPGAVHAFTQKAAGNDNSKGAAYNEAADKASWEEMKQFFERLFGSK
jgi:dienelactone hydrolase